VKEEWAEMGDGAVIRMRPFRTMESLWWDQLAKSLYV